MRDWNLGIVVWGVGFGIYGWGGGLGLGARLHAV